MRLEVRCCCQPTKLLGHIDNIRKGQAIVMLAQNCKFTPRILRQGLIPEPQHIMLPIQSISVDGKKYLAIKAEGFTKEQLSEFIGFEPLE